MNLYLIRHGRTDTVQDSNIIQSPDTPLGKYGKNQAKKLARKLKLIKIDHLYTSDYQRAIDTAAQISKITSISIVLNPSVRERQKDPALCGARIDSEINLRFIRETQENLFNLDWKFNDQGESFRDLQNRTKEVVNYLTTSHPNDSVAIVSHAYFIEMFLAHVLLGDTVDDQTLIRFTRSLNIHNAGVTSLRYNPGNGTWKLITLNDYSHLKDDWLTTHNL